MLLEFKIVCYWIEIFMKIVISLNSYKYSKKGGMIKCIWKFMVGSGIEFRILVILVRSFIVI